VKGSEPGGFALGAGKQRVRQAVIDAGSTAAARERAALRRRLGRSERFRRLEAALLVAPLFLYLLVFFLVPILGMLWRSVDNTELRAVMPRTAQAIGQWDGEGLPDERVFATLAGELREAYAARTLAVAAKRLAYDVPGFRSLMLSTARKLPDAPEAGSWRATLVGLDPQWGETSTWAAIRRAAPPWTPIYLLAAVDRQIDERGEIVAVPPDQAIYLGIFLRTFWISFVVTALCLVLGYPLAYKLASLPARISNLLLILVLLPFWTSLLVRTGAWVVLLQREGVVNDVLIALGLIREPLQLVYNRFGVYVAMTHAAASLGARPLRAFLRVYLPQTVPGIGAGCLLVFILAIGYYITPALIGGINDQMVSYFVAFFTNQTVNWGMASALGTVLLIVTLLLFALYARLVGIDRLRLN
jgi:putative spermidine/putrescine transport system permease protein